MSDNYGSEDPPGMRYENGEWRPEEPAKYVWVADGGDNMCDYCAELDGTEYASLEEAPELPHPNCNCMLEEIDSFSPRQIKPHPWTGKNATKNIWGDLEYRNPQGEVSVHPGWDSPFNRDRFSPRGMEELATWERNVEQDRRERAERLERKKQEIRGREQKEEQGGGLNLDSAGTTLIIRKQDIHGNGAYGVSRDGGTRKHDGIDIVSKPGDPVYALYDGKFERISNPYDADKRPELKEYTGLAIRDTNGNLNIYWYVDPVIMKRGDSINKGIIIGYTQDRAKMSPGMTNHYHFEVRTSDYHPIDNRETLSPMEYLSGFTFK